MDTLEKENKDLRSRCSPEIYSPEHIAVAFLLKRFEKLSKESYDDLMSLGLNATKCQTEEEYLEIMETMREILFPDELIGKIHKGRAGSIHQTDNLKKRSDWIGKQIKEKRMKKGWTQDDLAKKCELPQPHISRLEAGVHSPSNKTLKKIAKALGISVGDLDPAS
ncbi:MAG: helix-turn-helix transcriptional regulator [Sedimentisphaerales bacterium]|nr:helix-turn-helix transcriptional regulator [Sedimentisphaerales bacterium]